MKALFIIVLCLLNTLLEAQNICLKGRLVDEHKNAVSSATVRCFIHDSVFVKGDISDMEMPQSSLSFHRIVSSALCSDLKSQLERWLL